MVLSRGVGFVQSLRLDGSSGVLAFFLRVGHVVFLMPRAWEAGSMCPEVSSHQGPCLQGMLFPRCLQVRHQQPHLGGSVRHLVMVFSAFLSLKSNESTTRKLSRFMSAPVRQDTYLSLPSESFIMRPWHLDSSLSSLRPIDRIYLRPRSSLGSLI